MSKEMRRERNRITARESRDRKAAYIVQLEAEVRRLNEQVHQLEYDLSTTRSATGNPFIFPDDSHDTIITSSSLLLSPEQMGFFDS